MTDLTNGKIDFFGYEVNPSTTLQEFEEKIGNKFTKEVYDEYDMVLFYMNGEIGVYDFIENDTRFVFELYGMKFINVVIDFSQNHIWRIELITNMVSFTEDSDGKRHYSDEKVCSRFKKMTQWTIGILGEPDPKSSIKSTLRYFYAWGNILPSSLEESGNPSLCMTFNK